PRLQRRIAVILDAMENVPLKDALTAVCAMAGEGTARLDLTALVDRIDHTVRPPVLNAAMAGSYADVADPERTLDAIVRTRKTERDKKGLAELHRKVAEAQNSGDVALVRQLTARLNDLHQARLGLKG